MEDSFRRRREQIFGLRERRERERGERRRKEAGAISTTCPGCGAQTPRSELARKLYVCPACGYHHPIGAYLRLSMVLDTHSFRELDERIWGDIPAEEMKQLYETLLRIEKNLE